MSNKNILPPGFKDNLPPFTESEHNYTNKIIKIFAGLLPKDFEIQIF